MQHYTCKSSLWTECPPEWTVGVSVKRRSQGYISTLKLTKWVAVHNDAEVIGFDSVNNYIRNNK